MSGTETITEFSHSIIGYIETDSAGNKTVRDFSRKILGYYHASSNTTTNFYGKILYFGDMSAALLVLR
jgi:hypothetical protein